MATFIQKGLYDRIPDLTLVMSMDRYPFIFSGLRKWKLRRHASFWFCWWLFSAILYSFSALSFPMPWVERFPVSCVESLVYLPAHMFLAYTLMYWVVPKQVLTGKYVKAALTVLFLFICTAAISMFAGVYILPGIKVRMVGVAYLNFLHAVEANAFRGLLAGLRGAITIGGLAAAIKLMKYWYMKEQRNLQLQKQNAESQLQLLKAQVHPHFLFNTLNNIYSHTQNTSPLASQLLLGLSDMLRYMLYECSQPLVPLHKELKMLQDYILIEQARYNNGLDVVVDLPQKTEGYYIAPLLLLPFVENCFKHGTSEVLEQPWISLRMTIKENRLEMKLVNGKAENQKQEQQHGIGIANVLKRLDLIYPGRHELKISNEEDVFVVILSLELERRASVKTPRLFEMAQS